MQHACVHVKPRCGQARLRERGPVTSHQFPSGGPRVTQHSLPPRRPGSYSSGSLRTLFRPGRRPLLSARVVAGSWWWTLDEPLNDRARRRSRAELLSGPTHTVRPAASACMTAARTARTARRPAARQEPPTPTPRARLRVPSPLSGGVRGAATPVNCLGWAVNYQRNKPAGAGASRTYSRRCVDPDENKKKKNTPAPGARADGIDQPRLKSYRSTATVAADWWRTSGRY